MDEPNLSDLISQRVAEIEAELPPIPKHEPYFELVLVEGGMHTVLARMTTKDVRAHNGEINFKVGIH